MAIWETVLIAVSERNWIALPVMVAVFVLVPLARTVRRYLSTRTWDRYLRGAGASPEVRLRLIIGAAERDLGRVTEGERSSEEKTPPEARAG